MLSPKVIVFLSLASARRNAYTGPDSSVFDALWRASNKAEDKLTDKELREAIAATRVFDHITDFAWACRWVAPFPDIFA